MEKSCPKIWDSSFFFKKLAKVNNHPIGVNSPNPVTLAVGTVATHRCTVVSEVRDAKKAFFVK
jgi:hypothetical protein